MTSTIIGYTGFVGSNIGSQHSFDDHYNSSNIAKIDGKEYDLVVSAATRADKWRINQEPESDLGEIDRLISHLKTIKAKQFVLISTIDIYKTPVNVDEDTPIETDGLHAYGLNRYHLEEFCREWFDASVIRLPGLFGQGLKKNVIFDLLHDNNVDRIHHAGEFQYYNLDNIWKDILVVLSHHLTVVNFATEPVRTDEIAKEAFGMDFINEPEGTAAGHYDIHSKYAKFFGGQGFYLYNKQQEIADITLFVEKKRKP